MAASSLKAPVRKTVTTPVAKTAAGNFAPPTGKMNGPSAPKTVASAPKPVASAALPVISTTTSSTMKFTVPVWARWVLGALAGLGFGYGIYKKTKK